MFHLAVFREHVPGTASTLKDEIIAIGFHFRYHLDTDMKDKELSFWTTPPHCLLVISDEETSKILGIISMQKKSEEIAEMNRLVVRPEARGLGLGRKLVHGLIGEARKSGFKQVFLETTDAQKDARRLYEKVGFVKIGESGLVHMKNATFLKHFHGLFVCKYIYNIKPTEQ